MRSKMTRGIGGLAALGVAGSLLLVPTAATAAPGDETTDLTVLTINDFHGRIEVDDYNGFAGAAGLAGAVQAFQAENPNTILVSAGDNIGASTFTSFIQDDVPTMQALAMAGLTVSAVGNHEFDKGYVDLVDRVIPTYDEFGAPGSDLALGANVYDAGTTTPALQEYAVREIDGVTIGFIGTITSDTRTLVSPAGIEEIDFGDQVEAANRVAAQIDDEVDVTVLLTHSGAEMSGSDAQTCETIANEQTEFGELVRGASDSIDAIVSGHTHQGYPCEIDGRPVIQANDYGSTVGALDISVDAATNELVSISGDIVPLMGEGAPAYEPDADVAQVVADAVAVAEVEGSVPVGQISADILRGGETPGDDRGVESAMGNLVADVYLWSTTEYANYGGEPADLAVMNPGGLRDDLRYGDDGVVTYMEVANVQPFANTLTTSELTGADIELMLEQQWQPGADRPKLHLGISEGFSYEYVDDAAEGEHVVSMTLDGEPIAADETYTVTTNSFISAGGDDFTAFHNAPFRDTGLVDLEATVDYFDTHDVVDPAPLGRAVAAGDEQPNPEEPQPEEPNPEEPRPEEPTDPADPSERDLAPGLEGVISVPGSAAPGDDIVIEVPEQLAGAEVETFMFSTPVSLGTDTVSASATFAATIPADATTGEHRIAVYADGAIVGWAPIDIVAADDDDLAATGGEANLAIALFGALLVAAGLTAVGLRRRRA